MSNDERESFVNSMYDIFNPKDAKNLHEITEEGFIKNVRDILGAFKNIDKETKDSISRVFLNLFVTGRKNIHLLYPEDNKSLQN